MIYYGLMFKFNPRAYLTRVVLRKLEGFDAESVAGLLLYQEVAAVVFVVVGLLSSGVVAIANFCGAVAVMFFRLFGQGWPAGVRQWSLALVITAVIAIDTWGYGGLNSVFTNWYMVLTVPMLLMAGHRMMWRLVGLVCAVVLFTAWMQYQGWLAPQPMPGQDMMLPVVSVVMMMVLVLGFPLWSYVVLQQLIARQRARNEELQRARTVLLHQRQQQDEFIASISHELRTPMNAILGFLQTVNPEHVAKSSHTEMFGAMNSSAQHLLTVINDLLDFSQIQMGRLRVTPRPMALHTLLKDVSMVFRSPLREAGIDMALSIAPDVPRYILGDADRITQIIINLMGNAVKFTREGQVTLRAFCPSAARLRIEVEDTGCGIAPAQIQTVFDRFSSLTEKTRREYGGTGLGLSISQNLVQLMGGEIGVNSQVGQGSTFWFELDVVLAREADLEISRADAGPPQVDFDATILIVDDSPVNRLVARQMIRQAFPNFTVMEADSGFEALDAVKKCQVDLVLMDVIMREMDGIETTRRLISAQCCGPILGLTADVTPSVHQACLDAGMLRILTKPYTKASLIAAISEVLRSAMSGQLRQEQEDA